MNGPCHIVIVGRDCALWLSAAALRQALAPLQVQVTVLELPSCLRTGTVHATLPAIEALHSKLRLDEPALLSQTGGSFSLGWNIRGTDTAQFFLAHGCYGAPIEGSDFFGCWVKARRFGLQAALEDFSPTAMAARHGRMLLPDADTERFGRTDYGYHLPAIAYAALLKSVAVRLGVVTHQVTSVATDREADTGLIRAVIPAGGPPIAGDLFIDASGMEAVLIDDALGVPAEDWRPVFPFDRRLTGISNARDPLPAYAELRLSAARWTALQAVQGSTAVVQACHSTDEGTLNRQVSALGLGVGDAALEPIEPKMRSSAWSGNCVAVGASACVLDPLFDLELHAAQLGLVHLLSLFPTTVGAHAERTEYNRVMRSLFERLRDFQAALYLLAGFPAKAPESLEHKIATYRARATIAPMEDETFADGQWRALFVGLGAMPESWPPAIDTVPADRLKDGLQRILHFVNHKVREQPAHDLYLAKIGAVAAA